MYGICFTYGNKKDLTRNMLRVIIYKGEENAKYLIKRNH